MKPTIKDVAKAAGVSVGTASKVINRKGQVAAALQEKVRDAVVRLNYHPNAVARSLKSSSTRTIAILLGDITNPFQMMMAKGVEEAAYSRDYQLLIGSTKEDPEVEKKQLQVLMEKRVEGIVYCSTGKVDEEIRTLLRRNVQIVFVDRPVYEFHTDIIADDCMAGMELLVRHLAECGHRRVGVVHGNLDSIHGRWRYDGAMRAFVRYGLDAGDDLQFVGNFTFDGGVQAVSALLAGVSPPTALIAANNNMAAGILRGCRDRNIRIPQDVSVASFGPLEYAWNLIAPTVTHVTQSPLAIGRKAAELLLNRLERVSAAQTSPTHLFLPPELIVGESTGVPGPERR